MQLSRQITNYRQTQKIHRKISKVTIKESVLDESIKAYPNFEVLRKQLIMTYPIHHTRRLSCSSASQSMNISCMIY